MIDNFTTIDEYIDGFEGEKREILKELRKLIQKIAPEATETINYKMPTFRLNGNLIHFAMFKNHLGVYPGAETIEHFKADLTNHMAGTGFFTSVAGTCVLGIQYIIMVENYYIS